MGALLLHWLISAVSLLIVAYIIPGIQVQGFGTALIAAIVIGLVNATLGFVLKILTLPLTLLTFGLFWFVINAFMLLLTSWIAQRLGVGFRVDGFVTALIGSVIISIVSFVLSRAVRNPR